MSGRFAPTPSADLHLGNLRTALVSWLAARSTGRDWLVRIEDLDLPRLPEADAIAARHLADLATLGLVPDGAVVRQSGRTALYEAAFDRLDGAVYECFCSRKDVAEATRAPHGTTPRYPGTCRSLGEAAKAELRRTRPPAWRVDARAVTVTVTDRLHGPYTGVVDDFVVRRADGVFAYNFAVVVDDGLQGVDQVVRGDDLLESAPRQAWLAGRLGFTVPEYLHVPLVLAPDGTRLAKRDRAGSLAGLAAAGLDAGTVLAHLAASLGLAAAGEAVTLAGLTARFDPARLPLRPWYTDPAAW